MPYRGLDEWVRTAIPLGGSALVVLAAVLAFWPRRTKLGFPGLALLALMVLYVVPVVALIMEHEFWRGAAFTLLMVIFLRLEKLRRTDAPAAVALALAVTVVAFVAAPMLNRDQPWFDYETWAAETSTSKSTTFTWSHSYDGLNWPRDGRELLRVRAQRPAVLEGREPRHLRRREVGAQPAGLDHAGHPARTTRGSCAATRRRSRSRSATCAPTGSSRPATRSTSTSRA